MLRNLARWKNKSIRLGMALGDITAIAIGYVVPLAYVISYIVGHTESKMKIPLVALAISICLMAGLARFFGKAVSKLSIYDSKSQVAKHVLEAVGRCIVPAAILTALIIVVGWLKDQIDQYAIMCEVILACTMAKELIDRLFTAFLEDEWSIREKAKEQNAIASRRGIAAGD